MTGPAPQQIDPRIAANIPLMQKAKWDEGKIRTYLQTIEHVNPDDYLQSSGGGIGQTLAHAAGGLGRMAVQGVGNLASIPFGLAGAAYQGVTGNQPPALLQGGQGTAAADQMGLPQYQGAGERILGAGVENAIGGAIMPGGGAATAMLGGAAGAAGQGAGEMGAGPMGQMAASAAVGMGIPVVGAMLGAMTRAAMAGVEVKREAAKQSLALMQAGDASAPVTLGQVTQGGMGSFLDSRLRKVPGAAEAFSGALDAQAQGLGQRTQAVASSIGPVRDPIQVGRAVQRGIEKGFVPRFNATSQELYNKVDSYVPAETPVTLPATTSLMEEQNRIRGVAGPVEGLLGSPFLKPWWEALAAANEQTPQGVPFEVVKALRSRLGNILSGAELVSDVNMGEVKRLYGAMTEDMGRTVQEVGGTDGMLAWKRATLFTKKGHDRLENVLQPLMDKKTPEVAYRALMSGTKEGGTILRSTMQSLEPEQRRLVAGTVTGRLGMAAPGEQNAMGDVFSADRFMTNWASLSPVAKGALYGRVDPYISKDLDQLAKAMDLVKSANRRMPNPAGTASNVAFGSIVAGLSYSGMGMAAGNMKMAAGGLAPLVGLGASQQLAKRVLTNPKMVHWLVGTTKIPLGMLGKQLALLAKQSQGWSGEDKAIAQQTIESLSNTDWHQVLMGQALADSAARQQ